MNKQVNFTTVMDYRQTFTVDLDFEEVKKELMENNGFDDEEVRAFYAVGYWLLLLDLPKPNRCRVSG